MNRNSIELQRINNKLEHMLNQEKSGHNIVLKELEGYRLKLERNEGTIKLEKEEWNRMYNEAKSKLEDCQKEIILLRSLRLSSSLVS